MCRAPRQRYDASEIHERNAMHKTISFVLLDISDAPHGLGELAQAMKIPRIRFSCILAFMVSFKAARFSEVIASCGGQDRYEYFFAMGAITREVSAGSLAGA
jgi:hypothetical protein